MNKLTKILLILTPLFSYSFVLADDGSTTIQSLPPEVLAISLRKLIQQGDYQSFLKAQLANKATFQAAINSDPVLKGTVKTLQSIKEPMETVLNTEGKILERTDALESAMKGIIASAKEASGGQAVVESQIINSVSFPVFRSIKEVIDKPSSYPPTDLFLYQIGVSIPIDYLTQFDMLLLHVLQLESISREEQYDAVAGALLGLARNENIPSDAVLKRIEPQIEQIASEAPKGVDVINRAFLALASRANLGEETIKFFKSEESNPIWQETLVLREALEKFKNNPAYSK